MSAGCNVVLSGLFLEPEANQRQWRMFAGPRLFPMELFEERRVNHVKWKICLVCRLLFINLVPGRLRIVVGMLVRRIRRHGGPGLILRWRRLGIGNGKS